MPSFASYIQEIKSKIREAGADEVSRALSNGGPRPVVIDVREKDEWDKGFIPGSKWIPRGFLELRIEEAVPEKDREVVLYCAGGTRSALAAQALQTLGYTNVKSMRGGFGAWTKAGHAVDKPVALTPAQQSRYSRHTMLPEVGEAGQARLLESRMLLVGAGGLGSPSGYYLAAAGVGTLGIVDDDVVDDSNLQRQILHSTERVGIPKVESAQKTLQALNPDVKVVPYKTRLSSENALDILSGYDVIVQGCDNFPTRYLVNDAAIKLGKPVVDASVYRFEGQLSVYVPGKSACYRCMYPEPPPPEMAPSCADAGVLGVLPGVMGILQATEALKLVLGRGDVLMGRILQFDALKMKFRELKVRRDPACLCGKPPSEIELIDYEGFCTIG